MEIFSWFGAPKRGGSNPDYTETYEGEEIDKQIMNADERGDTIEITGTWHDKCRHTRLDEKSQPIEQGPNDENNKLPWWKG